MLSSSKSEWVALLEAAKEVTFMIQLLGNMKSSVKLPVMVRVDNLGAIFVASNITTISCTKHVEIRYKYVGEYLEDGAVKIIFVKLIENDNNVLTKKLK